MGVGDLLGDSDDILGDVLAAGALQRKHGFVRRGEAVDLSCHPHPASPFHSYSLESPWPLLKRFRGGVIRCSSWYPSVPGKATCPGVTLV